MISVNTSFAFAMEKIDLSMTNNDSGTLELNSAFSSGKRIICQAISPNTIRKMAVALER